MIAKQQELNYADCKFPWKLCAAPANRLKLHDSLIAAEPMKSPSASRQPSKNETDVEQTRE
jgi:hypothetical protein